jgi:protein tyrosine phosphatase (PTP) superfamily phosphohydrolase (DUF442 family)
MTRRLLLVAAVVVALGPSAGAQSKDWLRPSLIHPGLWRGHAPYRAQHYEQIKALGVRTILDMRGNQPFASARERRLAAQHGLDYINVPISFRPLRDGSGDAVVAAMADASKYPMYVHCNLDRDRTSAAVAAYRVKVQGWSVAAAEREAKAHGIRWQYFGLNRYIRAGGG